MLVCTIFPNLHIIEHKNCKSNGLSEAFLLLSNTCTIFPHLHSIEHKNCSSSGLSEALLLLCNACTIFPNLHSIEHKNYKSSGLSQALLLLSNTCMYNFSAFAQWRKRCAQGKLASLASLRSASSARKIFLC